MKPTKTATVSELLQHVRVTELECACIEVNRGHGAMFVAQLPTFHFVLQGECWLQAEDGAFAVKLSAGDFVLVPHGIRHSVSDGPNVKATTAQEAQRLLPHGVNRDAPTHLRFGTEPESSFYLLSGNFRFPNRIAQPFVAALPAAVVLRQGQVPMIGNMVSDMLERTIHLPSGKGFVQRLADVYLLEALRSDSEVLGRIQRLTATWLRSYRIEQAIAAITANPAHPWTLGGLAKSVGMSRTAFASKYLSVVGMPPMQHVGLIRLQAAAALLRSTSLSVGEVANRSGYASESSFSRVFRRTYNLSPTGYRKASWVQPLS